MTDLAEPEATNLPKFHIWSLAEQFALREGFMPGDRLEPLLARLGVSAGTAIRGQTVKSARQG